MLFDIEEYKDRAKIAEIELGKAYGKITSQRIIIVVLAVLLLSIIYFNNYQIVLRLNGLRDTLVLTDQTMSNGTQVRFIYSNRPHRHGRFAELRRNRFGIWSARDWYVRNPETGMVISPWTSFGSHEVSFIYHSFFSNDNAFSFIEIDNNLLPQGVTVQVHQFRGGSYMLHFQVRMIDSGEGVRTINSINEDFVNYLIGGFIR